MRTNASTIAMMVATLLAGAAAIARPGDSDREHEPVTVVSDSQFYSLLKSGQLHLSGPAQVRNEARQFELKERIDKKIVDEFIHQHPDLPGLARLVAATPTDPGVFRMSNGNYQWAFTNQQGATQVVQTMGQEAKLAALAGSIRAAVPQGSLGGYFIIKNSWGCNAGDAGYYYMPAGYLLVEAGEVVILP